MRRTTFVVLSAAAAAAALAVLAAALTAAHPRTAQVRAVDLHVFALETVDDLRALYRYQPDGPPLLHAHRGGARPGFPENALETFENTLRHTWAALEVDPRWTRDGVLVLFHDPTLERTSTGHGRVADHTWAELQQLRLKDPDGTVTPYHIPTLDEALAWAKGRTVLLLDDKGVDILERARAVQRQQAHAWAIVMAYSFDDARRLYEFDPDILMQVFLPDAAAVERFEATGVPWRNVVGFVTHTEPSEPDIFQRLAARGALGVLGTSRTVDRAYLAGKIDRDGFVAGYRRAIASGAQIVEADLAVEAGEALEPLRAAATAKRGFFRIQARPSILPSALLGGLRSGPVSAARDLL
ncbi:MAG TPA: glycerophosphodiester phosphodiesterase family protein [Longimicrobiaceae bacterium]